MSAIRGLQRKFRNNFRELQSCAKKIVVISGGYGVIAVIKVAHTNNL